MNILENNSAVYDKIVEAIDSSRLRIVSSVNSEMVLLYWNIGRIIKSDVLSGEKAEYGKSIINELSAELTKEYGKGYGQRNLFNMVKFYDTFPDDKILQTLSAKLSWSHFVKLLSIADSTERDFYIALCINEHWSIRTLADRINSMLFERTAISKLPESTIANDLKQLNENNRMSAELFFRDPYVLDFLELRDTYSEKDLENAILAELEDFLLEMGKDFAFLGRQVRISIGDKDYYIDLLFYHRKLRRLVLIELKLGEFLPEHKGQVELYLRWLQKYEMNEGEESPIAIILCSNKDDEEVELLELDKSGIHVAQYLTQLPPKKILQEKLQKAIAKARNRLIIE